MRTSDLFVQCLENEKVEYIFGIPGEENLDFLDSLRSSSIKFIITRHEQAAAFMAATYGRLTGKPGVVLSTLGPGATNLLTGIAYAQLGGMPLVAITGQKSIKNPKQGEFQIVDIVGMMKPVTKSTKRIDSGDRLPILVRNAFKISSEERPGVVHLELPEDIASEETEGKPILQTNNRRPAPDPKAINQALEMISKAKQPIVMVAAGANRKRISESLTKFVDKSGFYFFTTQMGKGVIDERNSKYLGCAALSSGDSIHKIIEESDLIISIGHDIHEKPPALIRSNSQKVININFFSSDLDEFFIPDLEIIGDIANTLQILSSGVPIGENTKDNEAALKYEKYKDSQSSLKELIGNKIDPSTFSKLLRKSLPDDAIVTLDNGLYKLVMAKEYKAYHPNTLLLDNALATMGAGLPSAIAAKLINPDKQVVAVVGDGGFMMNSQELETAVRLNTKITVIILKDNAFGMIKWKQSQRGLKDFGLDYGNPDFIKYAESYGIEGRRVHSIPELQQVLSERVATQSLNIIEVLIDYTTVI